MIRMVKYDKVTTPQSHFCGWPWSLEFSKSYTLVEIGASFPVQRQAQAILYNTYTYVFWTTHHPWSLCMYVRPPFLCPNKKVQSFKNYPVSLQPPSYTLHHSIPPFPLYTSTYNIPPLIPKNISIHFLLYTLLRIL